MKTHLAFWIIVGTLQGSFLAGAASFEERLREAPGNVRLQNGAAALAGSVRLERIWTGPVCRARLQNVAEKPLRIGRIDLFELKHELPGSTRVYGEGFQMLAQIGGTLEKPQDWGSYPDRAHYKLEEPEGLRTAHGMLLMHLGDGNHVLFGFTSCRRLDRKSVV